ncbi:putative integrase [Planoprotostelium fungivorum]|uniref:Putative integrase n=1 Tax=Planoprotostelium fungivorum TaxID=1890364 RepID=A0A2P6MSZ8_9EUKA|nr:putative integrase [Planoprotostelium fungivorum]
MDPTTRATEDLDISDLNLDREPMDDVSSGVSNPVISTTPAGSSMTEWTEEQRTLWTLFNDPKNREFINSTPGFRLDFSEPTTTRKRRPEARTAKVDLKKVASDNNFHNIRPWIDPALIREEFSIEMAKLIVQYSNLGDTQAMGDVIRMYMNWFGAYLKGPGCILWKTVYRYDRIRNKQIVHVEDVHFDLKKKTNLKDMLAPAVFKSTPDSKKEYDFFNLWWAHEDRNEFENVEYNPITRHNTFHMSNLFNIYNPGRYLQRDWAERERTEDGEDVDKYPHTAAYYRCSIFFEHVRQIWCHGNEDLYHYTIRLLAYFFQHPELRPDVAIILYGKEGSGKSIIVDIFGQLFGQNYVTIDAARFNSQFSAILDSLKERITSETLKVRPMYRETKIVDNYLRWIIATNIPQRNLITPKQRRAVILGTSNILCGRQGDPSAVAWFKEILTIEPTDLAVCLSRISLSGFDPRDVYKTSTEKQWLRDKLPSVQEFWLDSIKAERIGNDNYWAQNDPNHEVYPRNRFGIYVPKTDIYKSYVDWYGLTKESKMVAENEFWKQTWAALGGCIEEERKTTAGNRLTSVRITSDSVNLRKALVDATGQPYLFDNIDTMVVSKDPLFNTALDIRREIVFNLSQLSIPPEKRPMVAPVDQRNARFQDYSKEGSQLIQAVSRILAVDCVHGYVAGDGCGIDFNKNPSPKGHLGGILFLPLAGTPVAFRFTPLAPVYEPFDITLDGDNVLYVGPIACKRFSIQPARNTEFLLCA